MSEKPYEDIDLEVDEEKFHALVAKDEKAYQDFKDTSMGRMLLAGLSGDWSAPPPGQTTGDLLRLAAAGRREYAESAPYPDRTILLGEAEVLESAAKIADGDLAPLYGLLPSWRWGEAGLS